MTRLTDKQLVLLSRAAQREDGAATLPDGLKGAAATKAVATLIKSKLLREVRARPNVPTWRRDQDGRTFALLITRAGRDAIGVDPDDGAPDTASSGSSGDGLGLNQLADAEGAAPARRRKASADRTGSTRGGAENLAGPEGAAARPPETDRDEGAALGPRPGTKLALVIDLLGSRDGASLDALIAATGWLPHTTRAALTGVRRRGYVVERTRDGAGQTIYRILDRARREEMKTTPSGQDTARRHAAAPL